MATRRAWLIRIAKIAGVVVGGVVLALALSIPLAGLDSARRLDALTDTTIPGANGAPDVRAFVAYPRAGGPHPAIILAHEFWGLNQDITDRARLLAEEGYVVIAPDLMRGRTTDWFPRALYQTFTTRDEQLEQDLDSVYAWTIASPDVDSERVGIVGFCFGGRAAGLYSLHNPKLDATVIFYGDPPLDVARLSRLQGPVLGIFGSKDRIVPVKRVEEFRAALDQASVDSTITIYPGQGHAFVRSVDKLREGGAAGKAWSQMRQFLLKYVKGLPGEDNTGAAP